MSILCYLRILKFSSPNFIILNKNFITTGIFFGPEGRLKWFKVVSIFVHRAGKKRPVKKGRLNKGQ